MPRGDKQQIMNYPAVITPDNVLADFVGIVAPQLSAIEKIGVNVAVLPSCATPFYPA